MKIVTIDLTKSRLRTDFGRGFYLTDKLGGAHEWALRNISGTPTVTQYEINPDINNADIKILRFNTATHEWLEFVRKNREREGQKNTEIKEPRHNFDVVSGPIANDKVAIVVDEYCRELKTAEEALKEIRVIPNVIQYSLHTQKAVDFVTAVAYQQYKNGKWSNWIKL
jgi:hypothetical protein